MSWSLECRSLNSLREQSWFSNLDMRWYQRNCRLFGSRALILVVSALLKLMGQLHQCMQRNENKLLHSPHQIFFVHICSFQNIHCICRPPYCFQGTFWQWVEHFFFKVLFFEPGLPKSVQNYIQFWIMISCCWLTSKGFLLKRLKIWFYRDIMTAIT